MRTPCASGHGGGRRDGRADGPQGGRDHQQLSLVVDIQAHPMAELAAARLLVLATDELRADGFIVCHLRLTVEG